ISREIGDRRKENLALAGLGRLASALGEPAEARRLLLESRRLAEEIGDRVLFGSALFEEGVAEERKGNLAEAEARYGEAFAQESFIPLPPAAALALAALGRVLLDQGRVDDARSRLTEALELGRELSVHGAVVCNAAHLARIEPARASAAEAALTTNEPRLDHASKTEARFALWQATGEKRHLEEAHRLLEYLRDHAPSDCRDQMISGVRLHRAISEAWA
ncbi:MAG: tetratricopeptide repeat protein, partial [Planctomycetota bacterium]